MKPVKGNAKNGKPHSQNNTPSGHAKKKPVKSNTRQFPIVTDESALYKDHSSLKGSICMLMYKFGHLFSGGRNYLYDHFPALDDLCNTVFYKDGDCDVRLHCMQHSNMMYFLPSGNVIDKAVNLFDFDLNGCGEVVFFNNKMKIQKIINSLEDCTEMVIFGEDCEISKIVADGFGSSYKEYKYLEHDGEWYPLRSKRDIIVPDTVIKMLWGLRGMVRNVDIHFGDIWAIWRIGFVFEGMWCNITVRGMI